MSMEYENPCGLDGFAFLEFSSCNVEVLERQFKEMGFTNTQRLEDGKILLFQQGNINFIVNKTKDSQAYEHAKVHGAGACAMGFKVANAEQAFAYAIAHGAKEFYDKSSIKHNLPAIEAIGGSVIYFVDDEHKPFSNSWENISKVSANSTTGLVSIDHLTHNVYRGNMDKWADFYANIFNFREIRFFNIVGQMTGLISRALSSPCNKIKIPLNESKDDKSQIEEFLKEYHGEGIQHIALTTENIFNSIKNLRYNGNFC